MGQHTHLYNTKEWKKRNPYCMVNGEYMITKYYVKDVWIYVLYKNNYQVGMFSSFNEAKEYAI
jgi:hypothetical protein